MNARQLFVTSVISASLAAAAASTAWAGEARTQRAGEAFQSTMDAPSGPALTRADVRAELMQARAQGQLMAAGDATRYESFGTSSLARADVRQATLDARLHGELMPAGERSAYASGRGSPVVVRPALFARLSHR